MNEPASGMKNKFTPFQIYFTCSDFIEMRATLQLSHYVLFQDISPEIFNFLKATFLEEEFFLDHFWLCFKYVFKIVHIPVLTGTHFKKIKIWWQNVYHPDITALVDRA